MTAGRENEPRSVQIRRARETDLQAVEAIVKGAYRGYIERIGRRPGPMDDDYLDRIRRKLVWVAEDAGEPVGLIVLIQDDEHLLVENVAVRLDRQGEGIGGRLLAFAEGVAMGAGLVQLRLYTHELMRENLEIYDRLGYREVERRQEGGFHRVFLSKDLSAAS